MNSTTADEPAEKRPKIDLSSLNLSNLGTKQKNDVMPQDVMNWLSGETSEMPEQIRQLGQDMSHRLMWYQAYVILAQYSRLPQMFNYLEQLEKDMFDAQISPISTLTSKEKRSKHQIVSKELEGILEYSRKFVLQNSEFLKNVGMSEADKKLLDKIKSTKPEVIGKIIKLLEENGE